MAKRKKPPDRKSRHRRDNSDDGKGKYNTVIITRTERI